MPPGVVTLTTPVVPLPTTAVILVLVAVYDEAFVPPNLTLVAPSRWAPLITTLVLLVPTSGEIELIAGAGTKVNLELLVTEPPGLPIVIFPVDPLPTTAVILVLDTILKEAAGVRPNTTLVTFRKLVPVTVTVVSIPADLGEKVVIWGVA